MASRRNNWLSDLRNRTTAALEKRKKEDDKEDILLHPEINQVDIVNWHCKDNGKTHHTSPYDLIHDQQDPQAVLRRGEPFKITITFKDRDFSIEKDKVVLHFEFGSAPSIQKSTLGAIQVENNNFTRSNDEWDIKIDDGSNGKDLVLHVFAPTSVPVGRWCLKILTGLQDQSVDKSMCEYKVGSEAYILFNPFCKEDTVYMEDEAERKEYVMNDNGKVFQGTARYMGGKAWAFGQFDDVVLPVAVYLLDLIQITDTERSNSVPVVRAISSAVNSNDNEGILVGRWFEPYSDGVVPWSWASSVSIIEKYVENGFRPVRYGQCWVFSALVTTICRALGIPCRSVTNFTSGHDTNKSLTIDEFFNEEGDKLDYGPGGCNDSYWNFHVWNDVWMTRLDLPEGYGGWQAIDATPQEMSDGKWQCGPASLEALRRGDIGLGFDAAFIFAEVNGDLMHWKEDQSALGGWKSIKSMESFIGEKVVAKKVGKDDDWGNADAEDIIDQYKNKENSKEERRAIHNAIRGIRRAAYYDTGKETEEDVAFDLIEIDKIQIGDDFLIKLNVTNNADEPRSITAALSTRSIYYTGIKHQLIKKAEGKFVLQPKETQDVEIKVGYKEYWNKLVEGCMVKLYVMGSVQETGQTFSDEDDFMIEKPKLEIQVSEELKRNELSEAVITFKNPLDMPLTDCEVTVVGSGFMRDKHIKISEPVPVEGTFSCQIQFKPRIHGQRKMIATFNAKELYDINGSKTVTVNK